MKKILLIFPPYDLKEKFSDLSEVGNMQPPLGLGYLAAVLEKAAYQVRVIDAPPLGWGIKKVVSESRRFGPDLIGLSVTTVDFNKALKLARALKKKLETPIVIGGPHVTALPREVMTQACFDYGVVGEGEETLKELIKALAKGQEPSKVKGLVFRKKGKLVVTQPRPFIKELDRVPFPARHLMPALKTYHPTPATYKKFPVGTMITSRGCPFGCTFCFRGVFGNRWRFRSPQNVVDEMEAIIDQHQAAEIRVWDDTFNADPERVKAICRLIIKRGLKFSWTCLARVSQIDREMLDLMKKAGCWQISYGIESGNKAILASLNKGTTKAMVRKAIELTHRAGVESLGFFILGLPGESEQTIEETIEFAKSLPLGAANFSIATPYPGTKLWATAKKEGFLGKVNFEKLVVNLPNKLYYVPQGMKAKDLQAFERKAYKEFYRQPRFILRQLKEIESLPELWRKTKAFLTIQSI